MPKILIAEDSEINQKIITHLLRKLGIEYAIAANGIIALEMLSKDKYDFVFMDVMMPEKNGLEATRDIIRGYAPENRPIIIALTANSSLEDKVACREAGMSDFLAKPLQIDDVKMVLSKYGFNV